MNDGGYLLIELNYDKISNGHPPFPPPPSYNASSARMNFRRENSNSAVPGDVV